MTDRIRIESGGGGGGQRGMKKEMRRVAHISVVARFDATERLAQLSHFGDDFFLHQIETHGDQGHADDEVHGAKDERQLDARRAVDLVAGYQISKARRTQTDETEIRAVQIVPVGLPLLEQNRTADNVAHHDGQRDGDGHRRRLVVTRLLLLL